MLYTQLPPATLHASPAALSAHAVLVPSSVPVHVALSLSQGVEGSESVSWNPPAQWLQIVAASAVQ